VSALDTSGLDLGRLPRHVAIIMDGNGRWAQRRQLTRIEGHRRGKDSVRAVVEAARHLGIRYLSLFAFSTENWQRPPREVNALMTLLRRYLRTEVGRLMKHDVRVLAIGDLSRLSTVVRDELEHVVALTRGNQGLTVGLCVSYGGREDLVEATRRLARAARDGQLDPDAVDADIISAALGTADLPDPDLLIRTSGEMRLSNFYLWQLAYTELYVTETLWPDFREESFVRALLDFQQRERRFGLTAEQRQSQGRAGAAG
jgi:undecaprenyl diphosphate synthase